MHLPPPLIFSKKKIYIYILIKKGERERQLERGKNDHRNLGWRGRRWLRDLVGVGPGPVASPVEQSPGKQEVPDSIPCWVVGIIFFFSPAFLSISSPLTQSVLSIYNIYNMGTDLFIIICGLPNRKLNS